VTPNPQQRAGLFWGKNNKPRGVHQTRGFKTPPKVFKGEYNRKIFWGEKNPLFKKGENPLLINPVVAQNRGESSQKWAKIRGPF